MTTPCTEGLMTDELKKVHAFRNSIPETLDPEMGRNRMVQFEDMAATWFERFGEQAIAALSAGSGDVVTYEIWQDDMCVAGSDDYSDALHYLGVYSQDGSAKLYKITRTEPLAAMPATLEGG